MDAEICNFIRKLAHLTGGSDHLVSGATQHQVKELADELRRVAAKLPDPDIMAIRNLMKTYWGRSYHEQIDDGKFDDHVMTILISKSIKYGRENNL
jgi:hypothetical protein